MWNPYERLSSSTRRNLALSTLAALLVAWVLVTSMGWVGPLKLPSPLSIARAFGRLSWDEARNESPLLQATLYSLMRIGIAGVLVVMVGLPMGILMGASPRVNAMISPVVDPFRSAPIVAISPLLVMWFGIGEGMKVAFLFAGAVVYLVPMVRDAVVSVPEQHWISARDLGATPWEAVWHSVLPIAKPRIADAIAVSVSVMWTYITVAEYVNAERGLGQLIQNARRFSAMDQVFVGIIVIMTLALASYGLLLWIKRKLFPWETEV